MPSHYTSIWNPHDITFPETSHGVEEVAQLRSRRLDFAHTDDDVVVLSPHNFAEQIISRVMIHEVPMDSVPVETVTTVISNVRVETVFTKG
jgi:hypothetical protein